MISDAILIFLITSVSAIIAAVLKLLYDSKCKNCSVCWDCMKIDRDTRAEVEVQENLQNNHQNNSNQSQV